MSMREELKTLAWRLWSFGNDTKDSWTVRREASSAISSILARHPDEPAPREVDVAALRQLLLRCTDDSRADYEWRESARQGLVREALALLDAEPREAPTLPAGFKRREWQEGWMYTTAGQRHVFVGRDGSITAADCDAATVHAVLCFHFARAVLAGDSAPVDGGGS